MTTQTPMLVRKIHPIEIKAIDEVKGLVTAVVNSVDVIDYDQEIVASGAFNDSIKRGLPAVAWMHDQRSIVGGVVEAHEERKQLLATMQFDLDTEPGAYAFKMVARGRVKEWSVGFYIGSWAMEDRDGKPVRVIDAVEWVEVSPVLKGASPGTGTTDVKAREDVALGDWVELPYTTEHACRLRDPSDFEKDSFRRVNRDHEGKRYSVIMARLKGESTMTEQSYRYPKDAWTADEARAHCKSHDGIEFAPAGKAMADLLTEVEHEHAHLHGADSDMPHSHEHGHFKGNQDDHEHRHPTAEGIGEREAEPPPASENGHSDLHTDGALTLLNQYRRYLVSTGVEVPLVVSKAGARNSAADMRRIQAAHDLMVECGANCQADNAPDGSGNGGDGG